MEKQEQISLLQRDIRANEEIADILDSYGSDSFLLRKYIQDEKDKVAELLSNKK